MIKYKPVENKRSVREELEYWNAIYIIRSLNRYFNSLHGYDRGLRGISAEDFSMMVLEKIISGKRSWEKSTKPSFLDFCYDAMKSELNNFRHSVEYQKVESHDFSFEKEDRWTRIGLQDEYEGF
jgi:hypothetical protein